MDTGGRARDGRARRPARAVEMSNGCPLDRLRARVLLRRRGRRQVLSQAPRVSVTVPRVLGL